MAGGPAQPSLSGLAPVGRDLQLGLLRPQPVGLLRRHRDQAEVRQPSHGAVDHCLLHVPDVAQAAVLCQQARDREAVRGSLADQA